MAVLGYTLAELGIIAACFTCNVALVNSVKFIQYTLHYPYPLLISAMHMIFSWLACGVYVKFNVPALREYTFSRYMKEVFPVAAMASASIGCGNMALKYIFPSFHELLQQTSPAAQVLVCVLIYHQHYNLPTYLSMIPICGGAIMCSGGEVNFNIIGVTFSIGAVLTRALKNTMQAHLMTVSFTTIELLFALAPANLFFFMTASVISEGPIEPAVNLVKAPTVLPRCCWIIYTGMLLQSASFQNVASFVTDRSDGGAHFEDPGHVAGVVDVVRQPTGVYYYKHFGKEITEDDYQSVEKEAKQELEEFDIEDNNAEVDSVSSDEDGEEETGKE
ncbi:hypothetical protein FOZ60_002248 [Perkinsus olseni]|uniref:Sugar phosphate transporter domain-containing protein n=1 Tax=Perkinsus olseni TaxID=32597 RepID=A0A7J6NY93_PEROL|nr:hypothetical protein FOZ60_002248 [Perkinsus olseni]